MTQARADFGATLRRLREQRGLSQAGLAKLAGYDHSYVGRLEAGTRQPTREAVERLGRWLLAGDGGQVERLMLAAGFVPPGSTLAVSWEEIVGVLRAAAALLEKLEGAAA